MTRRIGVVADSHVGEYLDALPVGVLEALDGCDLVLHAGDLSVPSVLDDLAAVAPVVAVRGDHDRLDGVGLPETAIVVAGGLRIGLTHGRRSRLTDSSVIAASVVAGRNLRYRAGLHAALARRTGPVRLPGVRPLARARHRLERGDALLLARRRVPLGQPRGRQASAGRRQGRGRPRRAAVPVAARGRGDAAHRRDPRGRIRRGRPPHRPRPLGFSAVIRVGDRSSNTMVRAGLGLGALAALLVALAPTGDLASGPARGMARTTATIDLEAAVGLLGALAAVLLIAAAAAPWLWAHLAGVALTTIVAATSGLIVLTGRTSDDFVADAEITLERGGVLLVLAFWVGLAGVIVTLVGFRRVAMARADAAPPEGDVEAEVVAEGPRRTSGKATVSLVLGIAGFITVFASTLAIAFGTLALGDIRASRGALGGRGVAIAGLVLGFVALSLLIALVGSGMLSATPSD